MSDPKRKYKVLALSHLVVETDKAGNITKRERHPRGATVEMTEGEADRLVRAGGLVLASDADDEGGLSEAEQEQRTSGAAAAGGVTGGDGEVHPDHLGPEDDEDLTEEGDDSDEEEEPEPETDGLDEMEYADLQQAAKSRNLNAGGSADDLRARIREYDAANKSE